MDESKVRILGVVVAFHPERGRLTSLLAAMKSQVDSVLLIDNTPGSGAEHIELLRECDNRFPGLETQRMGGNYGIGKALNVGIQAALSAGYDFVYLSDQDSVPGEGMIQGLLECHQKLAEDGVRVGCICPAFYDATTGRLFNFQAYLPGRFFYRSVPAAMARPWMEVITTISSGSLIPCHVLEEVGLMKEDYFIDDVDTEWCHRARFHGFQIYGTSSVLLNHRLGDVSFRIWLFGWKPFNLYSPLRLYYRFRNYVLMVRLPHVPLRWSIRAAWYWLGNLYAYGLFAPHRLRNVKAIGLGIIDGLIGRSGPCRHEF